ncbi:MAG: GNAT family N-acetyltransferase [Bacteroidota bacterium]
MTIAREIIAPVDRKLLIAELTTERFLRSTNNGGNFIYSVNAHNSPHVLQEIGRLREITFRAAGGGTGLDCDLDHFDTDLACYEQLIVWSPEDQEIMGGYRYIHCGKSTLGSNGHPDLATAEIFRFSEDFIHNYLPHTIELGRSFVQPKYQPRPENRKGLFTLDNLWDGLGAIHVDHPDVKWFFGKVTMYRHYNAEARDMILSFMNHYFPDQENLVVPLYPLPITHDMTSFLNEIKDLDYKEGHRILNQRVRALGENIPPLVNAYMNLSPTMRNFGTSSNPHFGDVEETGILVTLADIYLSKKERHISSYQKGN